MPVPSRKPVSTSGEDRDAVAQVEDAQPREQHLVRQRDEADEERGDVEEPPAARREPLPSSRRPSRPSAVVVRRAGGTLRPAGGERADDRDAGRARTSTASVTLHAELEQQMIPGRETADGRAQRVQAVEVAGAGRPGRRVPGRRARDHGRERGAHEERRHEQGQEARRDADQASGPPGCRSSRRASRNRRRADRTAPATAARTPR